MTSTGAVAAMRMSSACLLLSLLLVSCSVSSEAVEKTAEELALETWHENLIGQIAASYREEDLERTQQLLENKRDGANPDQRRRYASLDELLFVALIRKDGFSELGFVGSVKEKDGSSRTEFSMKEEHGFALLLQPKSENQGKILAVNASGTRSTLIIDVDVEDWLEDGSKFKHRLPRSYVPTEDILMDAQHPYRLPLPHFTASPQVFIRRVKVRARFLLAGMYWNGKKAPMSQIKFEPIEFYRFAKGFRSVRAAPLKTLTTVAKRAEKYLGHILVASWFLDRHAGPKERKEAVGILIELLRSGRQAAEPTVLAALKFLVKDATAHDRDGWLRWWTLQNKG